MCAKPRPYFLSDFSRCQVKCSSSRTVRRISLCHIWCIIYVYIIDLRRAVVVVPRECYVCL